MRIRTHGISILSVLSVALVAAVTLPTAAIASGGCAPDLAKVKGFHGHGSLTYQDTAGGDNGEGGWEKISLNHQADDLRIDMHREAVTKDGFLFVGMASHGDIEIEDSLVNSNGLGGTQTYSGPLVGPRPNFGVADALIDRRKNKCDYEFQLGFGIKAAYSGDEDSDEPLANVSGIGIAAPVNLPESLKLHHTEELSAMANCNTPEDSPSEGCYEPTGGWTSGFGTLALCHSVETTECENPNTPLGGAEVEWSLFPIYKKHPKKQ